MTFEELFIHTDGVTTDGTYSVDDAGGNTTTIKFNVCHKVDELKDQDGSTVISVPLTIVTVHLNDNMFFTVVYNELSRIVMSRIVIQVNEDGSAIETILGDKVTDDVFEAFKDQDDNLMVYNYIFLADIIVLITEHCRKIKYR